MKYNMPERLSCTGKLEVLKKLLKIALYYNINVFSKRNMREIKNYVLGKEY